MSHLREISKKRQTSYDRWVRIYSHCGSQRACPLASLPFLQAAPPRAAGQHLFCVVTVPCTALSSRASSMRVSPEPLLRTAIAMSQACNFFGFGLSKRQGSSSRTFRHNPCTTFYASFDAHDETTSDNFARSSSFRDCEHQLPSIPALQMPSHSATLRSKASCTAQ